MMRWGRMGSVCLFVAVVSAGCDRSDENIVVLPCRSSDTPALIAQIAIGPAPNHKTAIVVRYPSMKPVTFQVVDESPTYYSAVETGVPSNEQSASLYFDRTSAIVIETFRTSNASRDVRLQRCDRKIDANTCKTELARLVQGPARDLEDCDNPSAAECESWRLGSSITSEVRLFCR